VVFAKALILPLLVEGACAQISHNMLQYSLCCGFNTMLPSEQRFVCIVQRGLWLLHGCQAARQCSHAVAMLLSLLLEKERKQLVLEKLMDCVERKQLVLEKLMACLERKQLVFMTSVAQQLLPQQH
jgi:hypothetical protein